MTCHFLDGSVAKEAWPCDNSTSGASSCCPAGATCYSNGVCQDEKDGVNDWLRVGCTDPDWPEPCLNECTDCNPPSPFFTIPLPVLSEVALACEWRG